MKIQINNKSKEVLNFINKIPKLEFHAHLNGVIGIK